MSLFIVTDIDKNIILFLNPFRDFFNLLLTNKYYYHFVINQNIYHNISKLLRDLYNGYYRINIPWYDHLFIVACSTNNPCRFDLLANYEIDIHAFNEEAFEASCGHGHLNVAKWLLKISLQSGYGRININENNERAFRWSCESGHIDVAKWLVKKSQKLGFTTINIRATGDYAFRYSGELGHFDVAKFLVTLCPAYDIVEINGKIRYLIYDS